MVVASDGERTLTYIMRVERDWSTGAPTLMAPEFDEGDARGMHPAMAIALGLAPTTPDQPVLTDAEASEIAAECVAAVDAQIDLVIANRNRDAVTADSLIDAIAAQRPATLRVLEWLKSDGRELKAVAMESGSSAIVLMATTIQSIADVLRDQGYDDEVRQMMDALGHSDAAVQPN